MTERMPDWLETLSYAVMPWAFILHRIPWIAIIVQVLVVFFAVMLLHRFGTAFLKQISATLPFSRKLVQYGHRAGGIVVFLLMTQVIFRNASSSLPGLDLVLHLNALLLITALTWLGVRCVKAVSMTIVEMNPADAPDNLQARRIQTQTKVLSRSMTVLIVLIGGGSALMTLPSLRQVGTSLLASAGVAGLVVGFAAKPVLGNLLAGMQIALSQPIRLQDVVIVQNEWGHVEEITGTYVVVRLWDQRRMIVPLQWFIENPFQNWTRSSSEILGTVSIWVDYSMPVDALRKEAERICRESTEWDRRLCSTQVVDSNERAKHIRVLVSAGDAGRAWDLRCRMREELIHFVQQKYPQHLPRLRTDLQPPFDRGH